MSEITWYHSSASVPAWLYLHSTTVVPAWEYHHTTAAVPVCMRFPGAQNRCAVQIGAVHIGARAYHEREQYKKHSTDSGARTMRLRLTSSNMRVIVYVKAARFGDSTSTCRTWVSISYSMSLLDVGHTVQSQSRKNIISGCETQYCFGPSGYGTESTSFGHRAVGHSTISVLFRRTGIVLGTWMSWIHIRKVEMPLITSIQLGPQPLGQYQTPHCRRVD